jgi:hypothetical protein
MEGRGFVSNLVHRILKGSNPSRWAMALRITTTLTEINGRVIDQAVG